MPQARVALLPDRGIVRVAGKDAGKLLQGIVTNDLERLRSQAAIHAALLSPQGKIVLEFFVVKDGSGFLLEVARDKSAELLKRLTFYRLRANVALNEIPHVAVAAVWGEATPRSPAEVYEVTSETEDVPVFNFSPRDYADPRLPGLGQRWLLQSDRSDGILPRLPELTRASEPEYQAHRIALGVPEGGKDYAFGDTFPHEANFDVLGGISFSKGCFVGQEVVSRMQHRGGARKRIVIVEGERPLRSGTEIIAGAATIGTIGSVAGNRGLALLRLDRAEEAMGKGEPLIAGGSKITMRLPGYLTSAGGAAAS